MFMSCNGETGSNRSEREEKAAMCECWDNEIVVKYMYWRDEAKIGLEQNHKKLEQLVKSFKNRQLGKIIIKYMVLNNEAKIACEQNLLKIELLRKSVKNSKVGKIVGKSMYL